MVDCSASSAGQETPRDACSRKPINSTLPSLKYASDGLSRLWTGMMRVAASPMVASTLLLGMMLPHFGEQTFEERACRAAGDLLHERLSTRQLISVARPILADARPLLHS